jgi:hypothetical protein
VTGTGSGSVAGPRTRELGSFTRSLRERLASSGRDLALLSQIVGRGLILPACQAPQELSDLDASRDRTLLKPAGAGLAGLVLV